MDIRKLQRVIVDGLEDVKGQDIVVFNTEHLSPLFERVVVASGTSNRQAKALATSVRDAVRDAGGEILSMEGGENGEWIIVDCGAAVVHVMQPAIRQYYHLEEIWGGKPVKMKLSEARGLVKASAPDEDEPAPAKRTGASRPAASQSPDLDPPPKKAASKKAPAKKATVKQAPAKKAAAKRFTSQSAEAKAPAAKKAPARKSTAKTITMVVGAPAKKTVPRRSAASAPPARKRVSAKTPRA